MSMHVQIVAGSPSATAPQQSSSGMRARNGTQRDYDTISCADYWQCTTTRVALTILGLGACAVAVWALSKTNISMGV